MPHGGVGTPFTKDRQPPKESKRVKKRHTRLKEAIGLDSWDSLQNYLTTNGVDKFISTLHSMKGRNFTFAYLQAIEFFKPKLARTEVKHSGELKQSQTFVINGKSITFD